MKVRETEEGVRLAERLARGKVRITASLLERVLLNARLRRMVMRHFEERIVARRDGPWEVKLPRQVRQDQADATLALLRSAERALERRLISRKVLRRLVTSFLTNTVMQQDEGQRNAAQRFAQRHGGDRMPSLMVISPTRSCNLRCSGCYSASGPTREHLPWDVFDRILTEAKTLWGLRFFTISGGEPLFYRDQGKDLIEMVSRHPECFFLMYTNGTLIDRKMAERMVEAGNVTPAISVEGLRRRTEERRGEGVFDRILAAMACLREVGVPFGVSLTATRHNADEILSDECIDFYFDEQQAVYGWIFQYMPIGRGYTLEWMVTPEQRLRMWRRTWQIIRERGILLADFWNSGTASAGCIAAGQYGGGGYLYIDWNGNVMPCVFVPYAAANIHEIYRTGGTLDDVYDLPYFQAIRRWQAEYALAKDRAEDCGNLLLPCSIRDHYCMARELIEKYHPRPEDREAAEALRDEDYRRGMEAYDAELRRLFDPIWQREYLETGA